MSDPFLGQITAVGFNFQPQGWALCDGRTLPVSQNAALFALLGTTFGGDGQQSFGLPDLRGRAAIGMGQGPGTSNHPIGQQLGAENVTLTVAQMPAHSHGFIVDATAGSTASPASGNIAPVNTGTPRSPATVPSFTTGAPSSPATLNAGSVQTTGGGSAFSVIQPSLAINYIIALQGIFPTRS